MVAWLAAALSFIVLALPGMAHADVVSEAEDWFNGISTMQADFIQVASDGTTASGVIHLRRPHQMKIVYDLDEPLILLTTRIWIHVDRPNDKTVTSYPISETPLSLLLKKDVRLRSDEFTTSSNVQNGIVRVMLAKETGEAAGELMPQISRRRATIVQVRMFIVPQSIMPDAIRRNTPTVFVESPRPPGCGTVRQGRFRTWPWSHSILR